ncbi:hypothetical protein, partial [Bradyrhizobium pachyrhizi]
PPCPANEKGQRMAGLPGSLSIALSLVGSIWLVGVVALLVGAPGELVAATFVLGLVAGFVEWRAGKVEH